MAKKSTTATETAPEFNIPELELNDAIPVQILAYTARSQYSKRDTFGLVYEDDNDNCQYKLQSEQVTRFFINANESFEEQAISLVVKTHAKFSRMRARFYQIVPLNWHPNAKMLLIDAVEKKIIVSK